jgi:hypothetical protein
MWQRQKEDTMITEMENSGSRKEKKNRDWHIQHIVLARFLES